MRSLSLKLALAFIIVAVIGVVLVALFVRQQTQREFDQFVLRRYQADLIVDLSAYYQQNGGWQNLNAITVRGPNRHFGPRGGESFPAPVILTDAQGSVIYGGRHYEPGHQLSPASLQNAVPVEVDGETVGWVQFIDLPGQEVVVLGSPESEFLQSVNRAILFGTLGAVVVALFVGIILARTISRPVREVTEATRIVAEGNLGYQVPVRTKDELGELAASFNQMSDDLAQSNEQRRQMTADIAHDLRTPLSVILGYMESLSTGKLQPSQQTFEIMYAKGRHLQHMIEDLRTLAMADAGELPLTRRPVEPGILLEHTALAHMVQAQEQGVTIRVEIDPGLLQIEVDPERMGQVFGNLVSNALRYTPEGGEIILSATGDGSSVQLKVKDTGAGIDPADLPHIFSRFYRSDRSRQQNGESGLGLAIARSIVEAHGGSLTVASKLGQGTTFTIIIPAGS
jgi:signal transduction histidine kinase